MNGQHNKKEGILFRHLPCSFSKAFRISCIAFIPLLSFRRKAIAVIILIRNSFREATTLLSFPDLALRYNRITLFQPSHPFFVPGQ